MSKMPKSAMVLAAGEGVRMRPLTDNCPKPLLQVAGKTMLDRVLDSLAAAGVDNAVVNHSYLGDMIVDHVAGRDAPKVVLSGEDERLETGGGTKRALGHLGDDPFFVLNADMVWLDGPDPALTRMANAWDPDKMDLLLLLQPAEKVGYRDGAGGDYFMDKDGSLKRNREKSPDAPYIFAGVRICNPALFDDTPDGAFSFLELFDRAESQGRLYGIAHDGAWFHIGTPQAFNMAGRLLGALQVRLMMGEKL